MAKEQIVRVIIGCKEGNKPGSAELLGRPNVDINLTYLLGNTKITISREGNGQHVVTINDSAKHLPIEVIDNDWTLFTTSPTDLKHIQKIIFNHNHIKVTYDDKTELGLPAHPVSQCEVLGLHSQPIADE